LDLPLVTLPLPAATAAMTPKKSDSEEKPVPILTEGNEVT
jgi:hypothetical protein